MCYWVGADLYRVGRYVSNLKGQDAKKVKLQQSYRNFKWVQHASPYGDTSELDLTLELPIGLPLPFSSLLCGSRPKGPGLFQFWRLPGGHTFSMRHKASMFSVTR